jgi:hypothetical protein
LTLDIFLEISNILQNNFLKAYLNWIGTFTLI